MFGNVAENCPNCAGKLVLSDDGTKKICIYCDSEFANTNRQKPQMSQMTGASNAGRPSAQALFQVNSTDFNKSGKITWEKILELINEGYTVRQYMELLAPISEGHEEMAMESVHQDLWHMVEGRVANQLLQDERMIVYVDEGIFSKAKEGFLVSDRRIFIIKKRKVLYVNMKELRSLCKTIIGGSWFFNDDVDLMISTIGCKDFELGVILALICTLVRECHPEGYKIGVNKQS